MTYDRCPDCRYDLEIGTRRCPECGAFLTWWPRTFRSNAREQAWRGATLGLAIAVGVLAAFTRLAAMIWLSPGGIDRGVMLGIIAAFAAAMGSLIWVCIRGGLWSASWVRLTIIASASALVAAEVAMIALFSLRG